MAVSIGYDLPTLEVNHSSGATYKVPLLYSLKPAEVSAIRSALTREGDDLEEAVETYLTFFSRWIPEDVLAELSVGEILAVVRGWTEESEERSGESMGESSASSTS